MRSGMRSPSSSRRSSGTAAAAAAAALAAGPGGVTSMGRSTSGMTRLWRWERRCLLSKSVIDPGKDAPMKIGESEVVLEAILVPLPE